MKLSAFDIFLENYRESEKYESVVFSRCQCVYDVVDMITSYLLLFYQRFWSTVTETNSISFQLQKMKKKREKAFHAEILVHHVLMSRSKVISFE